MTLTAATGTSEYVVVGTTMHVGVISVPKHLRGLGFGSAELDELCALADAHGWSMELEPSDVFGTAMSRLVPWYFSRGFRPMEGSQKMRRASRGTDAP